MPFSECIHGRFSIAEIQAASSLQYKIFSLPAGGGVALEQAHTVRDTAERKYVIKNDL